MGIYEHVGTQGGRVRLRELVTGKGFDTLCTSGYGGKPGELWYVQLCPPLADLVEYCVTITTPYILTEASKSDWTAYLNRAMLQLEEVDEEDRLHDLLKYGLSVHHWNEFVFQAYHLIDELTVYENIETPLLYRGIKSSERKAMVAEMLDRFQIVAKKDLFPEQLSGGQQQLVGVARAIIGKPKLLLADEPTGNLHSEQGMEIMEIFTQLNKEGMTIIQVTHSEKNAAYGSRIIKLVDGGLVSDVETKRAAIS